MWQNHATSSSQTKAVFEQYAFNPFGFRLCGSVTTEKMLSHQR